MSSSKFTLIGFYSYMKRNNDDLFSQLTLPSGIDQQTVIDNILLEGGEFESYYSDPYFLQEAIGVWSTKWNRTFTKWYTALNISYEPLENYDRIETFTESHSGENNSYNNGGKNNSGGKSGGTDEISTEGRKNESDGKSQSATETTTKDSSANTKTENSSGSTDNTVSAFNQPTLRPDTASSETNSATTSESSSNSASTSGSDSSSTHLATSESSSMSNSMTSSESYSDSENYYDSMRATDTWGNDHTLRAHGNIGVTTSQQMLQSELDIAEWNLYTHITDLFLKEFVIPLY